MWAKDLYSSREKPTLKQKTDDAEEILRGNRICVKSRFVQGMCAAKWLAMSLVALNAVAARWSFQFL